MRGVNNNFYSTTFTNSGFAGASTETVTTVSYDENGKQVYEYKQVLVTKDKSGNVIGVQVYEKEEKEKNNDDSRENEQQSDGDGEVEGGELNKNTPKENNSNNDMKEYYKSEYKLGIKNKDSWQIINYGILYGSESIGVYIDEKGLVLIKLGVNIGPELI
ncbi:MAG: hypothetical protein DRI88_11335, partial [Bacteroidetes bacterium]